MTDVEKAIADRAFLVGLETALLVVRKMKATPGILDAGTLTLVEAALGITISKAEPTP